MIAHVLRENRTAMLSVESNWLQSCGVPLDEAEKLAAEVNAELMTMSLDMLDEIHEVLRPLIQKYEQQAAGVWTEIARASRT